MNPTQPSSPLTPPSRGFRVKTTLKAGGPVRCPDPDSSCTTSNHGLRLRCRAPRSQR